jgi:hypothetical protein
VGDAKHLGPPVDFDLGGGRHAWLELHGIVRDVDDRGVRRHVRDDGGLQANLRDGTRESPAGNVAPR